MHITHKAYVYEERRVKPMLPLSATGLTILWIVLLVIFLVLEAATTQLVSIWFAVSGVGSGNDAACVDLVRGWRLGGIASAFVRT